MQQNELTITSVQGWAVATGGFDDGEPRIRDLELAERLGYERPRAIRDLIDSLVRSGKLNDSEVCRVARQTRGGGRPATEYWLTEAQALKVVAKSETRKADALLDEVIRVFVMVRRGQLPDVSAMLGGALKQILPALMTEIVAAVDQRIDARVGSLSFGVIRPWELGSIKRRLSAAADRAVMAKAYRSRKSALGALTMRLRTAIGWTGTGAAMNRMPASMLPYAERELAAIEREFERTFGQQGKFSFDDKNVN